MKCEILNLYVNAQEAHPKPPISSMLGQRGLNIMKFCKYFNNKTKIYEKGSEIAIDIYIYKDKNFKVIIKSPTTSYLLKKNIKIDKGSKDSKKIATLDEKTIKKIYLIKKKDFNSYNYFSGRKIIIGVAKSMGINISNKT
ncbi:uL11 family ribosomal protein [Candidatus Vidania fulgoroideorum]